MGIRKWLSLSTRERFPSGRWAPTWWYPLVFAAGGGIGWAILRFAFHTEPEMGLVTWILGGFLVTTVWRMWARRPPNAGPRGS